MREKTVKSVLPVYLIGAVWVIYALLFPLYRISDYIIAFVLSLVAYFISSKVIPPKKILVENKYEKTDNPEADSIIEEGTKHLRALRELKVSIKDGNVSEKIIKIEKICTEIFDYIHKYPKDASKIRKYLNYYLPTTVKLLSAYDEMSAQGFRGRNIKETLTSIEGMLDKIINAFKKQLDSLYADDALDISTDIVVLESMMAQEGLIENKTSE